MTAPSAIAELVTATANVPESAIGLAWREAIAALERDTRPEHRAAMRLKHENRCNHQRIAELYRQQKTTAQISLSIKRSKRYVLKHLTAALTGAS